MLTVITVVSVGRCVRGMSERASWEYRQADAETRRLWEAAHDVRTQPAAAGLPVQPEHTVAKVGAGAVVDVDYGDDSAGGVYVGRDPAPVPRRAGVRAFRAYVPAEERPWVLCHNMRSGRR